MAFPAWPDLSPNEMEQRQLALWKEEKLFQQTMEARRDGSPFVFYEGPPTANGRPGIHHVFSRTIKDLVCRFHSMRGESVTRIAGWDTHGLPVEIEVEKELKLSGKKDIERFGVEEFNARARKSVFKYQTEWESLSDRIAYWLDYEHPYITCSNQYIESVWWLLQRLHQRSLLYRGHRVLPYCPRCGTVLSSHELALGYETVTTNSVYVTFPLRDDPQRELLVWTTTPWTLLSNVAVAVRPDLEYGEYAVGNRRVILATARAELPSSGQRGAPSFSELGALRTFSGRELIGLRYRRPLEVVALPEDRAARVVIGADFVTADDGSGLVHLAPAFGADDFQAGVEHGLALVRPVAPDGTFVGTTWSEIEGRLVTARETNDLIIQRLKQEGRWHLTQPHTHTYPHCWRCSSPLIYYARDSWFVRTSAVKERMLELNRKVDWHPPEVGAGRFGEWLENNVDWALSRDRYWGTPLPVWVCDQDSSHVEVIGSYAELAKRWGRALPADFDPHKPFIDGYSWACRCGGIMARTPEVIDTWFDSGSMPYAQWHYPFEHQAEFERHFPADFICEGVDQTRGWFYSLLAIATTAFDSLAYRHVVVNELVLDAEGQKMSKSKGNVVDPWAMIEQHGADTIRLYLLASSQVWLPKRFDPRTIPEVAGKFFNALKNSYTFFAGYAGDWTPSQAPAEAERPLVDRWLLSRLDATVETVAAAWGRYDVTAGVAGDHGLRGRRCLSVVRPSQSGALLGPRFHRRPGRARNPARGSVHRLQAPGSGGALRKRLAAPRTGGNIRPPRRVSATAGEGSARSRGSHGCGASARLSGPVGQGRAQHSSATAAGPDAGGGAGSGSGLDAAAAARAAPARGECEEDRSCCLGHRSGAAQTEAKLSDPGKALRQAHPGGGGSGGDAHPGAAPGPGSRQSGHAGAGGRAGHLSPRGCSRRAGGCQ